MDVIEEQKTNGGKEFLMLKKFEDFETRMTRKLVKFPRFERYCICKDFRNTIRHMHHILIELSTRHYKKTSLTELDIENKYLQYLMKASYDNRYINEDTYHDLCEKLFEIGMMVGGWIKNMNSKKNKGE